MQMNGAPKNAAIPSSMAGTQWSRNADGSYSPAGAGKWTGAAQAQKPAKMQPFDRALPPPAAPTPQGGPRGVGVQTGFNAADQAINTGSILDRLNKESGITAANLSGDGARGVADLAKSQGMANAANARRGLEQQNAQQNMKEQAMQSELLQTAMANQSKIYGDMAQRQVSQIGLASQLQAAMIKYRNALAQSLLNQ